MKRISKVLCALFMSLSVMLIGLPAIHAQESTQDLIGELIRSYVTYQESAETDIQRVLDELEERDATEAEVWGQIMDYWSYVNTEMKVNLDVAPDGLPNDNTLCFVVLGYQLNPDGSMKDELIGRLQVALDSAKKYPNAYVACTGGGTAADNPDATEADQMAAWLIEQGLDPARIIVENKSSSTVENAEFTYRILRESVTAYYSENGVRKGATIVVDNAAIEDPSEPADPDTDDKDEGQKPIGSDDADTAAADQAAGYALMGMMAAGVLIVMRRKAING